MVNTILFFLPILLRPSHIKFLKTKEADVVLDAIKKYVTFIFTQTRIQTRKKIKCFWFNSSKEYINQEVLD